MERNIIELRDYGPEPLIINIERFSNINPNYRTTLWTGKHLQVTLMNIKVGGDIGLEMHPDVDQFIRIVSGFGLVKMGESKENLSFQKRVDGNFAVIIPAGTWHNLINIGNRPLKLYSIYAPPEHPFGAIHQTKEIAEEAEMHSHAKKQVKEEFKEQEPKQEFKQKIEPKQEFEQELKEPKQEFKEPEQEFKEPKQEFKQEKSELELEEEFEKKKSEQEKVLENQYLKK